jgi:hypothetical protein
MPSDRQHIPALAHWRGIAVLLALIAAIAAPLWHLHVIDRDMPSRHSDLVPVWMGVRALLHHENPYSDATTRKIQTEYYGRPLTTSDSVNRMGFVYPATIAIVLSILAPLSWNETRDAFLFILPVLTAITVPLWLYVVGLRIIRSHVAILIVLTLASWPVLWGIRLQQPTLIVAALIASGCFLLKRGSGIGAGILLALATIKPQLAGLLIAWLVLWALVHRRWRFLGSLSVSLVLLLIGAEEIAPGWFPRWHKAGLDLLQYTHQQAVLHTIFGQWIGTTLLIAIAAAIVSILWKLRRCEIGSDQFAIAVALTLATTVALLPTDLPMIYNDVFLLPAFLILIFAKPTAYYPAFARRIALALLGWGFIAPLLSVLGESIGHPSNFWDALPFQNALLPLSVVIALAWMVGLRADNSSRSALSRCGRG